MSRIVIGVAIALFALIPGSGFSQSLQDTVAAADAEAGQSVFRRCQACHTAEEGGAHKVGPNLWGVVGRAVASAEGFPRYSGALKDHGGEWTLERLDAFLTAPRSEVPGTIMAFPGVPSPDDRANLLAYLMEQGGGEGESAETAAVSEVDYGLLVEAPGVAETFTYCTACHSEMIVAQQGKTREHWADLMEWMIEEQGMNEIAEPDRSVVLDYLAEHYNEDRPNFPTR